MSSSQVPRSFAALSLAPDPEVWTLLFQCPAEATSTSSELGNTGFLSKAQGLTFSDRLIAGPDEAQKAIPS